MLLPGYLQISNMLGILPSWIHYDPVRKEFFKVTKNSKVYNLTESDKLDMILKGIDGNKLKKYTNCIRVQ